MRYLYYCNSTYQLINVLNLHWNRRFSNYEQIEDYSADLIMLNAYDNAKEIVDILKDNKLFENIILIDRVKIKGKFHLFKTIRDIIFPSKFLKRDYGIKKEEFCDYDVISTPKFNRIIGALWQINKGAELQIHEDGLGTYIINFDNSLLSKTYKTLYKIFNHGRNLNCIDKIYVNNIDLYVGNKKSIVKEIPTLSDEYKEEVIRLFSKYAFINNCKNIYWLSQILSRDDINKDLDMLLEKLIKYKNSVEYCPHPRNEINNIYHFDESKKGQIWELRVLNMKDMNNVCLISSHSTALLSPYMLYNMQPYLIFTFKMVNNSIIPDLDKFELIVDRIKQLYKDPSKVMVPNTIEEFDSCVIKYICNYGKTK